jgi:hypothetical protein
LSVFDDLGPRKDFSYNLLCNDLKADVPKDSYFFFLDSDDTLTPGAIERIKPHLRPDTAIICQFYRGQKLKPSNELMDQQRIVRGKIGMPCIILHHSKKDIADFISTEDADYRFIKEVSEKMPVKWVKEALVNSPKRSFGK